MAQFIVEIEATITVHVSVEAETKDEAMQNWQKTGDDYVLAVCEMASDVCASDCKAVDAEIEEVAI